MSATREPGLASWTRIRRTTPSFGAAEAVRLAHRDRGGRRRQDACRRARTARAHRARGRRDPSSVGRAPDHADTGAGGASAQGGHVEARGPASAHRCRRGSRGGWSRAAGGVQSCEREPDLLGRVRARGEVGGFGGGVQRRRHAGDALHEQILVERAVDRDGGGDGPSGQIGDEADLCDRHGLGEPGLEAVLRGAVGELRRDGARQREAAGGDPAVGIGAAHLEAVVVERRGGGARVVASGHEEHVVDGVARGGRVPDRAAGADPRTVDAQDGDRLSRSRFHVHCDSRGAVVRDSRDLGREAVGQRVGDGGPDRRVDLRGLGTRPCAAERTHRDDRDRAAREPHAVTAEPGRDAARLEPLTPRRGVAALEQVVRGRGFQRGRVVEDRAEIVELEPSVVRHPHGRSVGGTRRAGARTVPIRPRAWPPG